MSRRRRHASRALREMTCQQKREPDAVLPRNEQSRPPAAPLPAPPAQSPTPAPSDRANRERAPIVPDSASRPDPLRESAQTIPAAGSPDSSAVRSQFHCGNRVGSQSSTAPPDAAPADASPAPTPGSLPPHPRRLPAMLSGAPFPLLRAGPSACIRTLPPPAAHPAPPPPPP